MDKKDSNMLSHVFFLMTSIVLFYFAGFRPIGIDNDSIAYSEAITLLNHGVVTISEPAFLFIANIASFSDEPIRGLFLFYAAISIILKCYSIARYSISPLLSLLIYFCLFYILHDVTQIRAGASAAFFLFAYHDAVNGKKTMFILKMIMAFLFHYSAILFFPIIFFSRKHVNVKLYLFLPFIFMALVVSPGILSILGVIFSFLPQALSERSLHYAEQIQHSQGGVGLFQLSVFLFFIFYGISLLKKNSDEISSFDNISFKYLSLAFVFYFCLSPIPIISVRTFELMATSLIFILPSIINKIKPTIIVKFFSICWLIVLFYFVSLRILNLSMLPQY